MTPTLLSFDQQRTKTSPQLIGHLLIRYSLDLWQCFSSKLFSANARPKPEDVMQMVRDASEQTGFDIRRNN